MLREQEVGVAGTPSLGSAGQESTVPAGGSPLQKLLHLEALSLPRERGISGVTSLLAEGSWTWVRQHPPFDSGEEKPRKQQGLQRSGRLFNYAAVPQSA